jgi:mRNA interferase RelE/StbE
MLVSNDSPRLWRVRTGDYRVVYQIHDEVLVVLVVAVGHRRDVYDR